MTAQRDLKKNQTLDRQVAAKLCKTKRIPEVESLYQYNLNCADMVFTACRIDGGLHPWILFWRPTKYLPWEQFLELQEDWDAPYFGVVFNTEGLGLWVIHNRFSSLGGRKVLFHGIGQVFAIEKFSSFLKELS